MSVSLALKPEPVTVVELPGVPLVRLMEMLGVAVKVVIAEVEGPYAPIVWKPEAEAGITKVALQPPVELAEGDGGTVATTVPS